MSVLTKWFIFFSNRILLTADGKIPASTTPPIAIPENTTIIHLPNEKDGTLCRALSVEATEDSNANFIDLRTSFDILPQSDYIMAGKAAEVLYWDEHTQFCGKCGGVMQFHTDISKRCTSCGKEVWPQLAIAIIVAVTRSEEILLVQSRNFRGDYLGLVAGFVETGETLEECVHREVMEETHITIKNLQYVESQPWPYPCGLMIGFTAEYAGGDIQIQRSELNKGGWYHRSSLPAIPGKVSLARRLIDRWLASF